MSMREIQEFPSDKGEWPQFICDVYDIDYKDIQWDELTNSAYYAASEMTDENGDKETLVCVFPIEHLGGNEYSVNWLFHSAMPFACDCSLEFINKMVCIPNKEYPWRDRVLRYHNENNNAKKTIQKFVIGKDDPEEPY